MSSFMSNFFLIFWELPESGEFSLKPIYECFGLASLGLFTDTGSHLLLQTLRIKIMTGSLFSNLSLSCWSTLFSLLANRQSRAICVFLGWSLTKDCLMQGSRGPDPLVRNRSSQVMGLRLGLFLTDLYVSSWSCFLHPLLVSPRSTLWIHHLAKCQLLWEPNLRQTFSPEFKRP